MPRKSHENRPGWAGIAQGIIGNSISKIQEDIAERAKEVIIKIERKTVSALLLFIGGVFFLVGIVLLVNSFFPDLNGWVGWAATGIIIVIFAYFIGRDK